MGKSAAQTLGEKGMKTRETATNSAPARVRRSGPKRAVSRPISPPWMPTAMTPMRAKTKPRLRGLTPSDSAAQSEKVPCSMDTAPTTIIVIASS